MIGAFILGFIIGAVGGYLFLRNNQNIKDKVDGITDDIDEQI